VDVSDEMIRLAGERLRDVPNAFPHHGSGADLGMFPDGKFDFVYSYAVFQHIPSRDIVFDYLREARRVLKPGGIMRCQINGLPPHARQYDTWSGVRITPGEIREFAPPDRFSAAGAGENLDAVHVGELSQAPPNCVAGGRPAARPRRAGEDRQRAHWGSGGALRRHHGGRFRVWGQNLPAEADLENLTVRVDGRICRLSYIGFPEPDGVSYVNAILPEGPAHRPGAGRCLVARQAAVSARVGSHYAARPAGAPRHSRARWHQPVVGQSHPDPHGEK